MMKSEMGWVLQHLTDHGLGSTWPTTASVETPTPIRLENRQCRFPYSLPRRRG
jgi:hypothetical protein